MSQAGHESRALRFRGDLAALRDATLAISAELSLDKVLQTIVDSARSLVGARYAALGVLGDDGQLGQFVIAGLDPTEADRIGHLPEGKGLLGLLMHATGPLRLARIAAHPESCGFPPHHPPMSSFLGAPLRHGGRVIGSLYLTEKSGAPEFTAEDEALLEMLAAQAAVAVVNARLFALTDEALRAKVDELQSERRNLKAVVDQLPEGVVIVDSSTTKITLGNQAALALLGLKHSGAIGTGDGTTAFPAVNAEGEPMPVAESPVHRAIANGEPVAGEQLLLKRADGSLFRALVNAAPLYDAEGSVVGGIVAFQDITALKEMERLKDELISIISHELRNPLTAIRGRAQLMLRAARRDPGRQDDVVGLQAIDGQVEKLAEMVRELLDVSQLRLGLMELRRQQTDLVPLVLQAVEQFQATFEARAFRFEAGVDSFVGDWDGPRLEQVLFNLLDNAKKYSPADSSIVVRVDEYAAAALPATVAAQLPRVAEETACGRRWAVVSVADEGIGIPNAAQGHLFDRFYRSANAKGRAETGLGLGLYICHEIVRQHGGTIWLDSVENKGTTVHFVLPA